MSFYDHFIAISENTRQSMLKAGVPDAAITIVTYPIDAHKFNPYLPRPQAKGQLGLPKDKLIIGTACRFVREKDLDLFLRTAHSIHSRDKDVLFAMVGDGNERPHLHNRVRDDGLKDVVFFLGPRTDMINVWRSFDIFLFTSIQEPFGKTLLEAQACETPIVAAIPVDGGAIDVIKTSPGIRYARDRNPDQLAIVALQLLASSQERNTLGRLGRQWVIQHFDVEDWAIRIESLYDLVTNHTDNPT